MQVFFRRAARGKGTAEPPGGPYGRPKARLKPWGWRGGWGETLQECVVTRFEAPGLKEPQGPWRCVEAGGAGSFWNRGDVF